MTTRRKSETFTLAAVLTLAAHAIPEWGRNLLWYPLFTQGWTILGVQLDYNLSHDLLFLLFSLTLVLHDPKRFGLRIGTIDREWSRVVPVLGVLMAAGFVGCQLVQLPSWMGESIGIWLISPLAQDLLYAGFLYAILEETCPGNVHPRVPIRRALIWTGLFFSLWHVPNFLYSPAAFVCLQLCYTFVGFLCMGITRQWTGSVLYGTLTHSAVNFFAWFSAARVDPPGPIPGSVSNFPSFSSETEFSTLSALFVC